MNPRGELLFLRIPIALGEVGVYLKTVKFVSFQLRTSENRSWLSQRH